MGRGDRKTCKGKIWRKSSGNTRMKQNKKIRLKKEKALAKK